MPVFVEPVNGLSAAHYTVHYRGLGMIGYANVTLSRVANGYGGKLPCGQVIQPYIEYYITATDSAGNVLASVGSAQRPQRTRVVVTRSHPPPALPGSFPPEQCGED